MVNIEATEQPDTLFDPNSRWLKICLMVMFLLAALVRRDEIKAPGHLIEREYNSAIYARAFYFEDNDSVETWRKNNAFATIFELYNRKHQVLQIYLDRECSTRLQTTKYLIYSDCKALATK